MNCGLEKSRGQISVVPLPRTQRTCGKEADRKVSATGAPTNTRVWLQSVKVGVCADQGLRQLAWYAREGPV